MQFEKSLSADSHVTYKVNATFDAVMAEAIAADIRQAIERAEKHTVIIFELQNHDLDFKAFKALGPLGLELRKINCQMFARTDSKSIHALIRDSGLTKVLKPIRLLSEIPGSSPAPTNAKKVELTLDVSFINPFVDGTVEVLGVQCQLKAVPLKPLLKGDPSFTCQTDIAGIIGITSKSFHGNIAICFPSAVFLKIMSNMLGEEFTEITDDLTDGAAELTNMIFGHAKRVLNENGHTIEKALPSVVRGTDIKIDHGATQDAIVLPFTVDDACFFMEIGIEHK